MTLLSPNDNLITSSQSIVFGANIYDATNINTVILYGNFSGTWAINTTNSSGTNNTDYNITLGLSDGYYKWAFWSNDTLGNNNFSSNRTILVDATLPFIDFTTGTEINNSNKSQNWIFVNITFTETNPNTIVFNLFNSSGIVNSTQYLDQTKNINFTGLINGNYEYNITINDTAGNENLTATRKITLDTLAPTITLPVYVNGTIKDNSNTLILNISISDVTTSGSICLVDVNGTNQSISVSNGWCNSSNIALTGLTDGNKTITIWANDSANNFGLNNSYVVEIDSTTPFIDFTTGTESDSVFKSQNWIFVNITFTETNPHTIVFNLFNSSGIVNSTQYLDQNKTINFTGLINGNYEYNITINDTLGKTNTTNTRDITLDSVLPKIEFILPTPDNGVTNPNSSLIINTTITDLYETSAWIDWNKSLKGYWSFDDTNSTGIKDNSTFENFGIFSGTGFGESNLTNGKRGMALDFDGIEDYLEVTDGKIDNSTNGTISAWINLNGLPDNDAIFGYGGGVSASAGLFSFRVVSTGGSKYVLSMAKRDDGETLNSIEGATNLSQSTWYHIAVTSNGTGWKLYLNGVSETLSVTSGSNNGDWLGDTEVSETDKTTIGALQNNGATGYYLKSKIDEVIIFNRELNQSEISALYNNSANRLFNNFTTIPDGLYNYSAYAIDEAGNLNITSPDRQITLDTTPPTITIINPLDGIDQHALPMEFRITTNEASLCEISIDNATRITLSNDANLSHVYNVDIQDGNHNFIAYCNDSVLNNQTSSAVFFYMFETSSGAGGIPSPSISDKDYRMEIEVKDKWYFSQINSLFLSSYDLNNNPINLDNITIEVRDMDNGKIDIFNETEKLLTGKYELKFFTDEIPTNKLNITIITNKEGYLGLNKSIVVEIQKKPTDDISKFQKFYNENKFVMIMGILLIMIFLALIVIIDLVTKEKNKNASY